MNGQLWALLYDSFFKILIPGIFTTIPLTIISFSCALFIGICTALVQFADVKFLKDFARFYIWIIRGTPILVQLYLVFYGLPGLGIMIDPFPAAILVFSINEGAYSAENMSSAFESVHTG